MSRINAIDLLVESHGRNGGGVKHVGGIVRRHVQEWVKKLLFEQHEAGSAPLLQLVGLLLADLAFLHLHGTLLVLLFLLSREGPVVLGEVLDEFRLVVLFLADQVHLLNFVQEESD